MNRIVIRIIGMRSDACSSGIQTAIDILDGVESSFIDLRGKSGTFEIDIEEIEASDILAEIERLGYRAYIIDEA